MIQKQWYQATDTVCLFFMSLIFSATTCLQYIKKEYLKDAEA